MLAPRGLGDIVCPDYPDLSTCYDQSASAASSTFLVGSGPLAQGQTRVLPAAPASTSFSLPGQAVWWIVGGLLTFALLGGRRG